MDCPRCGAALTRISLGGARSVYCEQCRFADIESDHTRVSAGEESWDDALRRFRTATTGETDGSDDAVSDGPDDAVGDGSEDGAAPVESINGIGPVYAEQLDAVGIGSVAALAAADAAAVAAETEAPESTVVDWLEQARRLVPDPTDDGGVEADDGSVAAGDDGVAGAVSNDSGDAATADDDSDDDTADGDSGM
jgi:predicted flap endonuclease-1-like 5' DNA nuclease